LHQTPEEMDFRKLIGFVLALISINMVVLGGKQMSASVPHSVLATGKWIKLAIKSSGIYKITYSDLQKMGYNPATINPANIRLFGNGGGMLPEIIGTSYPDDLTENAIYVEGQADGHFDATDYILFYGKGPDTWSFDNQQQLFVHQKNSYTDQSFYFLTIENTPGLRLKTRSQSASALTHQVTTYNDYAFYEKDELNLIRSGRQWFGKELLNSQPVTISFTFDNVDETSPAKVKMSAAARSTMQSSIDLKYGTQLARLYIDPISLNSLTNDYAFTGLNTYTFTQPKAKFDLTLSYNRTSDVATGWLDYLEVNVRRKLIYTTGQMPFSDVTSFGNANIARFTLTNGSLASVWEITDPFHPSIIDATPSGNDLSFILSADTLRNFIAFDNSSFLQPDIVGTVTNQDLHSAEVPDLLIVTNPLFIDAAKRLADFRTSNDGLKVLIATTDNIYNEFSSGAQDLSAIRYFCKSLYDRGTGSKKLRYLLLMGDGSYDYKNRMTPNTNFIPVYESPNSVSTIGSYATDDYFGLLENGSGGSSNDNINIGIGRLPVKTAAEATAVVEKIIHYSTNTPLVNGDWKNSICFVADDKEYNIFMDQAEELANDVSTINQNFTIDKIYLDAYPLVTAASGQTYPAVNQAINQRVNNGTLLINYTGHGGEAGWADEKILTLNDIANWQSYNHLPVFITATCEFSRFDDPQLVSAGEQILLNPDGGGAALFSTIRLTFGSPNLSINKSLLKNWLTPAGLGLRMGDVLREAKLENGNSINTQKIVLLGDPSMLLAAPRYKVITSFINNKIPGSDTLHALSKVTVNGFVADNNNAKMTSFNGLLYSSIFDKPSLINTLGNDGGTVYSFWLQKSLIYKGTASVKDGEFSFTFIVPKDIALRYDKTRFSYYATNGTADATGSDENTVIGGFADGTITDLTGPVVRLFMNDTLFRSGGLTGINPVLISKINDASGINTLGTGIGHDITAVIDDKTDHTIILNDYFESETDNYQKGVLNYQLSSLDPGIHHLRLKVWDVLNNSTSADVVFNVKEEGQIQTENINVWPNPFKAGTTFTIRHNQSGKVLKAEIRIYNPEGKIQRVLLTTSGTDQGIIGPVRWDGTNDSGRKLGSGLYIFQVILENETGNTTIRNCKVMMLN
jgi:hypothetical protein